MADEARTAVRWEYLFFEVTPSMDMLAIHEELNRYGEAGWELVQFWGNAAVFKRPVSAPA